MSTHRTGEPETPISNQAAERYWQATLRRDRRADGRFVFAVRTTHIYCRPSCPARRPLRGNTVFFHTIQEAERQGFRPCQRCRPQIPDPSAALVEQVADCLGRASEESPRLSALGRALHVSPAQLRRAFRRATGLTPREFREAERLGRFKKLLRAGRSVTEALYDSGYGSPSRLYEKTNAQLGMTPASYQKGAAGMHIAYSVGNSSLGKVLVGATARGVSAVYLGGSARQLVEELRKEYPQATLSAAPKGPHRWLDEILRRVEGNVPSVALPIDVQATAFERRVWQELQRIPRGATRTYTQVAEALGQPRAVRAVARACAANPVSIVVPCHRVIRRDGSLAGYRWGLQRKQKLLAREAIRLQ